MASVNVKSTEFEGLIEKGGAGITSIPTLMAFRDGVLLYREAGALPEPSLRELISSIQAVNMDDIRKQIAEEAAQQKSE